MNRERRKGFLQGVACMLAILLLTVAVSATSATKSISVQYKNIQISIDGTTITPKDAKGNVVEPFTYNGTTFVPARAIGEALGKDVSWDSSTNTVVLKEGGTESANDSISYYPDTKIPMLENKYPDASYEIVQPVWKNTAYFYNSNKFSNYGAVVTNYASFLEDNGFSYYSSQTMTNGISCVYYKNADTENVVSLWASVVNGTTYLIVTIIG